MSLLHSRLVVFHQVLEHKTSRLMKIFNLFALSLLLVYSCDSDDQNKQYHAPIEIDFAITDSITLPQPENEYWYGGKIESGEEVVHYLLYDKPNEKAFELGSYSNTKGYRLIRQIKLFENGLMGNRVSSFGLLGEKSILLVTDGGVHLYNLEGQLVRSAREEAPLIDMMNSSVHTVMEKDSLNGFLVSHQNSGEETLMTTDPEFYQKHKLFSFYKYEDLMYQNHVLEIDPESKMRSTQSPRGYYNFSSINASNKNELLVVCNPVPRYALYTLIAPFQIKEAYDINLPWFQEEAINTPMIYSLYTTSSFTGVAIDDRYLYFSVRSGVPQDEIKQGVSPEDGFKLFVKNNKNYLVVRERSSEKYYQTILPAKVNSLVTSFQDGRLLLTQNINEVESKEGVTLYIAKIYH